MNHQFKTRGRDLPANIIGLRRLGMMATAILALLLFAPSGLLAQSEATIELSPMVAKSTLLSPVPSQKEINVVMVLPLRDLTGAAEFARRVATPNDQLYGKYLTPNEFAAAYGADERDYAAVRQWAINNGLRITDESIARTTLALRGTVAQFDALFNTRLNDYRSPNGDTFYSAASTPIIPNGISSKINGVIGLTNSKQFAPLGHVYKTFGETPNLVTTDASGNGPGGAYNAANLRNIYSVPAHIGGTGFSKVAVFEQGGFAPSDVQKYLTANKLPNTPVKPRPVNGSGTGVNNPNIELESVLDIDIVIGINPAVSEVLVYEDADDPFPVALLDSLSAVANDNSVDVLSISYGLDEALQGSTQIHAENQVLVQLAAQGITVTVSAGDTGAYDDYTNQQLNVADPGAQPFVTCIGGTTLFSYQGYYAAEEVWNLLQDGLGATGGGVSNFWSIPSWQSITPVSINGGSQTMRNVPDLAAVGNPATGVAIYSYVNGGWLEIGGTSVSAPIWGSYLSILTSGRATLGFGRFGFFNPLLYTPMSLPGGAFGYPLNDINYGNNGDTIMYLQPGYTAGLGYDNCTGWGSMMLESPYWLLTLPTKTGSSPALFSGLSVTPGTTSAQVSWNAAHGAMSYLIQVQLGFVASANLPIYGFYATKGTSVQVNGLQSKKKYSLNVYAVNRAGVTPCIGNGESFTTN